jgi:hypothetical protein
MSLIKVIIIDVKTQSVYEKEIEHTLKNLQDIVGGNIEAGHHFENEDALFVDEEGLFKYNQFFDIGAYQPFAGSGFIVGTNYRTGETISAKSDLREIKRLVKFMTRAQALDMF